MLIEVVRACDQLLTAELPVIHKYVAYALDKILITKNEQGQLVRKCLPYKKNNNVLSGFLCPNSACRLSALQLGDCLRKGSQVTEFSIPDQGHSKSHQHH